MYITVAMIYLAVTMFNYLILQYITVAMMYLAVTLFNYLILQYITVAMVYLASYQTHYDTSDNVCLDLYKYCYSI
jgi:hypothetical protein